MVLANDPIPYLVDLPTFIILGLFQHFNTPNWNTSLNLYQQAIKGFLPELARGIAWGVPWGCVAISWNHEHKSLKVNVPLVPIKLCRQVNPLNSFRIIAIPSHLSLRRRVCWRFRCIFYPARVQLLGALERPIYIYNYIYISQMIHVWIIYLHERWNMATFKGKCG